MESRNSTPVTEALATYRLNKLEGATPGELLLQTYDYIIGCCQRNDWVRAKKGIVELMGSLDMEYLDVSGPLWRIYEYCLDLLRAQKFDEALDILSTLRDSWAEVVEKSETVSVSTQETL